MSVLLPFEVQTETGWKQAGDLKEMDVILCFEEEHGLVYKEIRQCLIYNSNFTFTEFCNGPFRLAEQFDVAALVQRGAGCLLPSRRPEQVVYPPSTNHASG